MKKVTILLAILALCLWGGQAMASYNPSVFIDYGNYSGNTSGYESENLNGNSDYSFESLINSNVVNGTFGNNPAVMLDSRPIDEIEIDDGDDENNPDTVPAIPEPMTLVLVGLGLAGAGLLRKRS